MSRFSINSHLFSAPLEGSSHAAEWEALEHESNPEMYYEGLLQIGHRLEAENRLEVAAQVYTAIVTDPSPSRERVPEGRVRAHFHGLVRGLPYHPTNFSNLLHHPRKFRP